MRLPAILRCLFTALTAAARLLLYLGALAAQIIVSCGGLGMSWHYNLWSARLLFAHYELLY